MYTQNGLPKWLRWYRICLPVKETRVRPLGREDPLEKETATHSSILAWWAMVQRISKEADRTEGMNHNILSN